MLWHLPEYLMIIIYDISGSEIIDTLIYHIRHDADRWASLYNTNFTTNLKIALRARHASISQELLY